MSNFDNLFRFKIMKTWSKLSKKPKMETRSLLKKADIKPKVCFSVAKTYL